MSYSYRYSGTPPPPPPPAPVLPASESLYSDPSATPTPAPIAAAPTLDTPLTRDFPSLAHLSRAEVEALLAESNDPYDQPQNSLLEAYILTLPQVQMRLDQHEQLLQSIETKAQRNQAEQAPLEALRRETERYLTSAQSADQTWSDQLDPELQEAYRHFTPGSLHAKMVQGTSKIWDQSEELANAYVDKVPYHDLSDTPPDTSTFLRLFQELRVRYHRRALLAERWSQGTVAWPA